jgi:hypothetical protein
MDAFDDRDRDRAALARLRELPDYEPARDLLPGLLERLPSRRDAFRPFRFAAAAALLLALAGPAFVARPADLLPLVDGRPLAWNETFRADRFRELRVPGVGTLRADRGAVLRFRDPRRVDLEAGEVFAEVSRGFEIRAPGASARVRGTRFGVRAPDTVYVVDGAVDVVAAGGSLRLGPRQACVGPRLVEISLEDRLAWLARHERDGLRLVLDPGERAVVTPGAPLRWTLRLESSALAPVYLGRPADLSQRFSLLIGASSAPLDASRISLRAAAPLVGGLVRLDAGHPVVLEGAVDPALFRERGGVSVRAVFHAPADDEDRVWTGTLRSAPVFVEVRQP